MCPPGSLPVANGPLEVEEKIARAQMTAARASSPNPAQSHTRLWVTTFFNPEENQKLRRFPEEPEANGQGAAAEATFSVLGGFAKSAMNRFMPRSKREIP